MPRKRILLLIKGLGRGGAEQLLASAASYHDRDRFEYEVAYRLPWKDALVAELQKADLPVQCLAGARGAGWVRRIRRLIDQRAIGLIHSHSPVVAVAAKVIAPARVRRVYTEHNVWERYHPLTRWANALTFARSDHVFAVSDHVRDSIRGSESGLPDAVPYWDWRDAASRAIGEPFGGDLEDAVDRLEELLSASIRDRLVADVPVGALLSGGTDSSSVVAVMREQATAPVRTFTVGFDDHPLDESEHARRVAEAESRRSKELAEDRLGVPCRRFVYPSAVGSLHAGLMVRRLFDTAATDARRVNRRLSTDPHRLGRGPWRSR